MNRAYSLLEVKAVNDGERVITGKVSEWRGHVVSSDPANLIDSWYCFRPSTSVDLDSLPLTPSGKIRKVALRDEHHRPTDQVAQRS